MKSFKTQSKRILDLMINSIYTHKEIFLRELLSNCSDAIDKLYFKGLKEGLSGLTRNDFSIRITADKDARTLTISDNGIGMTADELEHNLGTIAESGSLAFKTENADAKQNDDVNVIGQFGVGFYSAFMVAEKVEVYSKAFGEETANVWSSKGTEGYDIKPCEKEGRGTDIVLYIKKDTDDEKYSDFLEEYKIRSLVKKYSDYIRYPIKTAVTKYKEQSEEDRKEGKERESYKEDEVLNSMIPLWKKNKSEITKEEYNQFYKDNFYDYEDPARYIHTSTEGAVSYKALLYIPSNVPYNYYSKNYEKGLKLYTDGVLITDKCADVLPDCFSFVKGLIDSELTLNISRETIQHDRQLKLIESNLEKKIKSELLDMQKNDRENYDKFFKNFGLQLKYGLYAGWGMNKELLQDLIMFKSVKTGKYVTLKEYVEGLKEEDKNIYYGAGKTESAVKSLPQSEKLLDAGYDILCFSDDVDEFAVKMLGEYEGKQFKNVLSEDAASEEDAKKAEEDKDMLAAIKERLGDKVAKVKVSSVLKSHPVALSSEGEVSLEMEKVMSQMPSGGEGVKANKVLEINGSHPVYEKLKEVYNADKEGINVYADVLYSLARLTAGLEIDDATALADNVLDLLSK
ncbi:MAG TPA: molecular chaperone HtpG [Clostridiales bacterium]|nr:molecular chaperone HtpG [Clostridiales bacterium]